MNRYFLYIAATTILTAACNRQGEEEDPVISVTGITHNLPATLELLLGATLTFEAAVEPAEAANQTVTWSTSDDQVATVNSAGELTAVAPGTATITATTDDGGFTATCAVTVTEEVIPVTGITLSISYASLLVGKTLALEAAIEPAEASNQTVTWSTSDASVATVNPEGELTAVAPGTATITATTDDGGITVTSTVTVYELGVITMTAQALEVSFYMHVYIGNDFIIDWGDGETGNMNDGYIVDYPDEDRISLSFSHNYPSASEHHITITGSIMSFNCGYNQLTTLDVSRNTSLVGLECNNNQLTTLDVNCNTALTDLRCYANQLTKLDVSNTALTRLRCQNNQLTTSALNELFRTLPEYHSLTKKSPDPWFHVYIYENPGASDCDVSIAEAKWWTVISQ